MNLLKTSLATSAALSLLLVPSALCAAKEKAASGSAPEAGDSAKVTAMDRAWAHIAAVSDKVEIESAKAAQTKAQSPDVKAHAQKMIEDHTKTTAELTKWAQANKVELNAAIPPEKKAVLAEISAKSGAEFDTMYMNHEIAAHRMAAAHFQNGTEFLMNPELKQFAQTSKPVIDQHLQMVDKSAGHGGHAMSGGQNGGAGLSSGASQTGGTSGGSSLTSGSSQNGGASQSGGASLSGGASPAGGASQAGGGSQNGGGAPKASATGR